MTQACKAAGLPVYLSSGYRSYSEQAANFQRVCANNGVSDGKNAEGHYITMPAGCSEHQTALCCDITDYYREFKNDSIAETATVQWLAEHCAEYGFILRFPTDKREITHVMGESWHFRYVGVEAAKYMTENNLCLEEFVALYNT
jgi:D-alanyl-D-alanine carboxypeptidase